MLNRLFTHILFVVRRPRSHAVQFANSMTPLINAQLSFIADYFTVNDLIVGWCVCIVCLVLCVCEYVCAVCACVCVCVCDCV